MPLGSKGAGRRLTATPPPQCHATRDATTTAFIILRHMRDISHILFRHTHAAIFTATTTAVAVLIISLTRSEHIVYFRDIYAQQGALVLSTMPT